MQQFSADKPPPTTHPPPASTAASQVPSPCAAAPPDLAAPKFHIDRAPPIPWGNFPDQNPYGRQPPTTLPNVAYVLDNYGISLGYNVIRKRSECHIPSLSISADNADNIALTEIISLCVKNGLNANLVPAYVDAIADRRRRNPVEDWIRGRRWDGTDRVSAIQDTLTVRDDFPLALRNLLIRKWLLSAVAAALLKEGFRSRGVLTLQGPQSIGKTQWVLSLVPEAMQTSLLKIDHHLDPNNKDSILSAIGHWIVELGELDSSLKDAARLKGVLTSPFDKVRRPYAKADSEYGRRTVFCATVNDSTFLVDTTGNSRWWTLPVIAVNFKHQIDMQQVFAQLAEELDAGGQWWLTSEEEQELDRQNMGHMTVSVIREALLEHLEACQNSNSKIVTKPMKPTEVLKMLGHEHPTNGQAKECAAILRERFGESKRIKGSNCWQVPVEFDRWAKWKTLSPDGALPAPSLRTPSTTATPDADY